MSTDDFRIIEAPQLGVNDLQAMLSTWHVADGDEVARGQTLCALETSKATFDVEADASGFVKRLRAGGAQVAVSEPLAALFISRDAYQRGESAVTARYAPGPPKVDSPRLVTAKAERLATELGVDLSLVVTSGVVREEDVREWARRRDAMSANVVLELDDTKSNVLIYGSGRGALTVADALQSRSEVFIAGYLDDDATRAGTLNGRPIVHSGILGADARLTGVSIALAMADGRARARVLKRCDDLGIKVMVVVHAQALVSDDARLGRGTYVKAGAIIDRGSVIGDACIIDNGAIIPHDNQIGDFCHLAPGAVLGSSVRIQSGTIVGIGASIATGITVGYDCILSVGCAVTKNVPDGAVVEGVPARIVGTRTSRA